MIPILIAIAWLNVVIATVSVCRVAARADAVEAGSSTVPAGSLGWAAGAWAHECAQTGPGGSRASRASADCCSPPVAKARDWPSAGRRSATVDDNDRKEGRNLDHIASIAALDRRVWHHTALRGGTAHRSASSRKDERTEANHQLQGA